MEQGPVNSLDYRLDKSSFRLLGTSALRVITIGGGIWSVLMNLYLLRLGYDARFIGILTGLTQIAVIGASLSVDKLSRRYSMKRVVMLSMYLMLISSLLFPLGELMGGLSAWWFILMRMLSGIATGIYFPNFHPLLTVTTPTKQRQQAFSLNAALTPFGGFIGSLIGGWLPALFASLMSTTVDNAGPYRWALVAGAILYIPALFLMAKTQDIGELSTKDAINPKVLPIGARNIIAGMAVVSILRLAGENAARTFLNVYLDTVLHTPTSTIGVITAIGQLLAAPAALMTPRICEKKGLVPTVSWGAIGVGVGLVVMAFTHSELGAGLGFLIVNAAGQIARPAYIVFIQEILGAEWRQFLSGITTAASNVGNAIVSFGGGYLATSISYGAVFATGAIASTVGGILFWFQFKTPRGAYATENQSEEPPCESIL